MKRRHPLAKENFLEGNRQKWCAVFTAVGLLIMGATSYGALKDPAPFLQFFLSIGVSFILGASATAVMNSWKTSSATVTAETEERRTESIKEETIARPRSFDSEEIP